MPLKRSIVWDYFDKIDNHSVQCRICKKNFKQRSNTSNYKSHLRNRHPTVFVSEKSNLRKRDLDVSSEVECLVNTQTATSIAQNLEYVDMEYEFGESVTEHRSPVLPQVTKIPAPPQVTKIQKPKPHNNSLMLQEAISILSNIAHTTTPETEDDEFGQFGKFIAEKLRQLPLLNALEIQEKFYSLLNRERINVMKSATQAHLGIISHVQQHQCNHQQQNKQCTQEHKQQEQGQDDHQYTQQQIPAKLQIESACTLNESEQSEIEIYPGSDVSTTIE